MKNVYFDVCGTLFKVNTTFGFIRFFHFSERNYVRYLYVSLLASVVGKVFHRFFNVSIRNLMLRTLIGERKEVLYNCSVLYVDSILNKNKNKKVFDWLEVEIEKNRVYLISASIEPVISTLARKLNVEFFCSTLKYSNSLFEGVLESDLQGNKDDILKLKKRNARFYTDNIEDIACAKYVEKLFFINKENKKRSLSFLRSLPSNVKVVNV